MNQHPISFDQHEVHKTFASTDLAVRAINYSAHLRSEGVATPAASIRPPELSVVHFDRIDGSPIRIDARPAESRSLELMLGSLLQLHRASAPAGLPPFDPLVRITPRLSNPEDRHLRQTIGRLTGLLAQHRSLAPSVLHGDVHPRQFLLCNDADNERASVWVVDLDDLCLGPIEADLGNLAAFLATRGRLPDLDVREQFKRWVAIISRCYGRLAQSEPDGALVQTYGELAAVRRLLKLRERNDLEVIDELSAWLERIGGADPFSPSSA